MPYKGRQLVLEEDEETQKLSGVEQAAANVQAAKDRIEELEQTRVELEEQLESERVELANLEESAGDRALDGDETAVIAGELTEQRGLIDLSGRALKALEVKQKEAKRQLLIAKAGELRAKAAELWATVQERRKVTEPLLKKLQDFEGWPFAPAMFMPNVAGAVPLGTYPVSGPTKSAKLIEEIRGLESQASAIERQAGIPSPPSLCGELVAIPTGIMAGTRVEIGKEPTKITQKKIRGGPSWAPGTY